MPMIGAFMVPHPPLIIPQVGRGQEEAIAHTVKAYYQVARQVGNLEPDTIVVSTPHSVMYSDYFHISPGEWAKGDFGQFRAKEVVVEAEYDAKLVGELCRLAKHANLRAGTLGEKDKHLDHATMIPLYFINQYYEKRYKLVRIGISGLPFSDHYALGQLVRQAADSLGRRVVFIASGDLSHHLKEDGPYGFSQEGPEYDEKLMKVMGGGDFGQLLEFGGDFCEKAGECGHRSFLIMAGALDKTRVEAERLSYEGPFGVGYGICAYKVLGEGQDRDFLDQYLAREREALSQRQAKEDAFVQLARKSLEHYVRYGEMVPLPGDLPGELANTRAGAFVSLKKGGSLRGCIGTTAPTQPSLAEEIIHNAVSAGAYDPRFPPVQERELDQLEYSVDVLGQPEPVDSMEDLDVKRYGVIVSGNRGRRGLLLPDLEGVDTVEEQVGIAKRKAGLGREDQVSLERFQVARHR